MGTSTTSNDFRVERSPNVSYRRSLPWLGLACILIAYVTTVVRLHPTRFFGYMHDDTLYFSSAKAIAEGRGYILPSVPGTPPATKYPALYPWMLSWVWRWNASFPANLMDAVAVSVFFAVVSIILVFVFLQRLGGFSDAEALIITAFWALHPLSLFYGANILTDIPFAAFALAAIIMADRSTKPDARGSLAVLCGILAGLATQMRSIGIAVIAGIAVAALRRRAWRQCLVFSASACAVLVPVMWRQSLSLEVTPHSATGVAASFGWSKAWVFYTSYVEFWRMSIPDTHVLLAMLGSSAIWLLRTPSDYFLLPSLAHGGTTGLVVLLLVTALIVGGIVRQARRHGWKPIHYVLPFYAAIVWVWNFSDPHRFFLLFLPLLLAGYWVETRRMLGLVAETLSKRRSVSETMIGGAFVALVAAGNAALAWNYFGATQKLVEPVGRERAALLPDKREAYDWISRFTSRDSRVVAYEDASLYLYAGRQAMRPIVFTTAELSEPSRMETALDHMMDVARSIGAGYWLESDDDFSLDSRDTKEAATHRLSDFERNFPVVFRSEDGRVRIYGLQCMQHPEEAACDGRDRRSQQPPGEAPGAQQRKASLDGADAWSSARCLSLLGRQ